MDYEFLKWILNMQGYYPQNDKEPEMKIIMQAKTERFEARLNVEQKELFVRSAAL